MAIRKNIPELRFPGFDGEWESKHLREVISNRSEKYNPESSNETLKCIELEHLATGTGQLLGYIVCKDSGSIKNRFKKGDVLFGKLRPYLRKYLLAPFDGVSSSEIWVITGKSTINEFIYWLIQTEKFIELANQSTGSKMPRADWNVIASSIFNLPSIPEQQKIASFFTAVDQKINLLKRKKTLLEKYKKGVMQKIFSQQFRFKDDDGNEFPKWEKKTLGKIARIFDGTHQTPDYVNTGIPFYSVEQVTADDFQNTKYISEYIYIKENQRVKIEKSDILMTRIGDIGTAKYIDWDVNASFYVSLALIKHSNIFNSKYLSHYISTCSFQRELWKRTIHVAFPKKINLGEIGECEVELPIHSEQTKIANFLSSIDEKISYTQKQIEKAEVWKKGLMQKMFV